MLRMFGLSLIGLLGLTACCPVWFLHTDDAAKASAMRGEVPAGAVHFQYTPEGPVDSVYLTGDFLDWEPTGARMRDRDGDGTFEATVDLAPGEHQYKFVINGDHWVADPNNQERIDDGMSGENSLLFVVGE